jgi:hypothetical protein
MAITRKERMHMVILGDGHGWNVFREEFECGRIRLLYLLEVVGSGVPDWSFDPYFADG